MQILGKKFAKALRARVEVFDVPDRRCRTPWLRPIGECEMTVILYDQSFAPYECAAPVEKRFGREGSAQSLHHFLCGQGNLARTPEISITDLF